MISVVLPTLNVAEALPASLASLLEANRDGLIREVVVADGGSADATCDIAEEAGARVVHSVRGRGTQLRAGAAAARGDWLLFLHADTRLAPGWIEPAMAFTATAFDRRAAVFRLRFDAAGVRPWMVARGANLRSRVFRLPYGDQGLLISRRHYDRLGGFAPMPLFEDVDLVLRIVRDGGRGALVTLPALAITSAARYADEGYAVRVLRNNKCLRMYLRGVPAETIAERYYGWSDPVAGGHGQAAIGGTRQDEARP
jgi:rSAM/selenodomain-associated transferase 2